MNFDKKFGLFLIIVNVCSILFGDSSIIRLIFSTMGIICGIFLLFWKWRK